LRRREFPAQGSLLGYARKRGTIGLRAVRCRRSEGGGGADASGGGAGP